MLLIKIMLFISFLTGLLSCSNIPSFDMKNELACSQSVCVTSSEGAESIKFVLTDTTGKPLPPQEFKLDAYCESTFRESQHAIHVSSGTTIRPITYEKSTGGWIIPKTNIPENCQLTLSVETTSSHDHFKFRDI